MIISLHTWYFSLHTFYTSISQLPHILKSIQPLPHVWFKFQYYFFTFSHLTFYFSSLSLSLSLSLSWICACAKGNISKKSLKQQIITNLLIFGLLWFFLNTNIVNLIFFFFFLFEQKVSKVNLIFLGHCGCLRLHHFILEESIFKIKTSLLKSKTRSLFLFIYLFWVKKHNNWSIYEKVPKPVWSHWFLVMPVELTVCTIYLIFLSFSVLTNNRTELRSSSQLNWPVWLGL